MRDENMMSVCRIRAENNLGCRKCMYKDTNNCETYKRTHHGQKPCEDIKILNSEVKEK